MSPIAVIDFGMGNLGSVVNAFRFLNVPVMVAGSTEAIVKAEKIVLPGVGSFAQAMSRLRNSELDFAIREAVLGRGAKILGICLGMQLLATWGEEGGGAQGLGLVSGSVNRLVPDKNSAQSLHIGFAPVSINRDSSLLAGIQDRAGFYFVHEYHFEPDSQSKARLTSFASHHLQFVASLETDNVFGVQFHPEKSQSNGLRVLANFAGLQS